MNIMRTPTGLHTSVSDWKNELVFFTTCATKFTFKNYLGRFLQNLKETF